MRFLIWKIYYKYILFIYLSIYLSIYLFIDLYLPACLPTTVESFFFSRSFFLFTSIVFCGELYSVVCILRQESFGSHALYIHLMECSTYTFLHDTSFSSLHAGIKLFIRNRIRFASTICLQSQPSSPIPNDLRLTPESAVISRHHCPICLHSQPSRERSNEFSNCPFPLICTSHLVLRYDFF